MNEVDFNIENAKMDKISISKGEIDININSISLNSNEISNFIAADIVAEDIKDIAIATKILISNY